MTTFAGPPAEAEPGIAARTLPGLLQASVASHRAREALVFHPPDAPAVRLTYGELDAEVRRLGRALLAAGVAKGTRVAVLMGNRPEWVIATFAAASVGAVVVPVNTLLEPPELAYVLAHSDASLLFLEPALARHRYLDELFELCPEARTARPGELVSPRFPHLRRIACLGLDAPVGAVEPLEALAARAETVPEEVLAAATASVAPFDDALVIYSSGTTAAPKGVLHAQRAPTIQSYRFAAQLGVEPDDRVWSPFPFFWGAGIAMILGATLASGGCVVLQEVFEPGEALRLIEAERVTMPYAWAHQLAALEDHPAWATTDLSSVRRVDPTSGFLRHPTVRIERHWSPRAAYGLTETFTIVTSLPADTPPELRGASHGALLPGNLLRIVDPETGEALGPGASGEIAVKGQTLMKGYLKVEPEHCFDEDGFFRTGDAGFVDEQGFLHWTGRADNLIKTAGANVSPVEVEEALLGHPALKACVVVGVPHPTLGEMVVACVVLHPGHPADEHLVTDHLRGRLASYKVPRRVLFFEEGELPTTANQKIRAQELRQLAASRLAAEARSERASSEGATNTEAGSAGATVSPPGPGRAGGGSGPTRP